MYLFPAAQQTSTAKVLAFFQQFQTEVQMWRASEYAF